MEMIRNFVRDNYVVFILGMLLLLIASLGSFGNKKMEYSSVEYQYTESVSFNNF